LQEEGDARDVAETRGAKAEQDLRIALNVHARESEGLKTELEKVKNETGEELGKLRSSLDAMTKEKEAMKTKVTEMNALLH
jgi:hypothetical protein